jgi:hypothetical protein
VSLEAIVTGRPSSADRSVVAGATPEAVMELLTQRITIDALASRAGELLMLHACALADPRTGDSVVLVGPSGVGKTTIARTLGTEWSYVTDEAAAVNRSGRLLPYPKPLSVDVGQAQKSQVSPDELGLLGVPPHGLNVRVIALLDRQPGAELDVSTMPTVEAITRLAEHTSFLTALETPLQGLAGLVRSAGGLRVIKYSEASALRGVLRNELRAAP